MRTPTTRTDLAPLVKRVTAFLDDFEASLGPTPPHLTTIDKRRAAKPLGM